MSSKARTIGLIVIGDEILSGDDPRLLPVATQRIGQREILPGAGIGAALARGRLEDGDDIVGTPGQRCDKPVSLMDMYPTLIELCGLNEKKGLEAHSLVPLLKDPKAEWKHAALTTHGRNNHAVRTERWRYIRYENGDEELYDESADPYEWTNLAGDPRHASRKAALAQFLPKGDHPDIGNAPAAPEDGGKGARNGKKARKASEAP